MIKEQQIKLFHLNKKIWKIMNPLNLIIGLTSHTSKNLLLPSELVLINLIGLRLWTFHILWAFNVFTILKFLSNSNYLHFYSIVALTLEKAMAPHSSTPAWKIPWTEEPGRLQSMGLRRVGHIWATSFLLFTFMHWRRKWQPTPVFLPGGSQGWQSLVGCRLWAHTESDMTKAT